MCIRDRGIHRIGKHAAYDGYEFVDGKLCGAESDAIDGGASHSLEGGNPCLLYTSGRAVSPAFLGDYMDEHGPVQFLGLGEYRDHGVDVMAIDGPQIYIADLLKEHRLEKDPLNAILGPVHHPVQSPSDERNGTQKPLKAPFKACLLYTSRCV